ncbi:MAG: sugar ABC transporter permease [Treponema sp.]|jgi:raffinose/stachyose/melibiose transport system permease protein|nr:sugar ABC transporter permease [Treponema sp.]
MVEAKSRKAFYFTAFIIPCLILYLIFFITPFFRGIGISLTNWDGLTPKTPIILDKNEFESKILYSGKLNQKERNYIQSIYEYDPLDNSYKRKSLGGVARKKLERIVKKTGYEPERYKFVGLENYKKIFTGKIDKDFYPHKMRIEKFTESSELPRIIQKKDFQGEVLKGMAKNSEGYILLTEAYKFDEKTNAYKLDSKYDEFVLTGFLWDLPGVGKSIPESKVDSLIRTLKNYGLKQNAYDIHNVAIDFANENSLSEKNKTEIIELSNEILKVSKIKKVLAENWVVTQRNMGVVGFTLFFAVFSVIGINVLAFALALALDTGIRGQKILRTIFFLPNVLSMIIVALIWSMLFVQLLPAITGIEKWISDSNKTPWLLVLVAVWQGCGYYMIVYLAGLQNIPTEVIEAAKIDGATGWQRFKYITLPLMIPSLTISLFLTIANALKSFDLIYAMIGQTGYATGTVPFVMDIYFDAFSLKQAGLSTAKAMVLFFAIVIITGIQLYVMKRKEVEA